MQSGNGQNRQLWTLFPPQSKKKGNYDLYIHNCNFISPNCAFFSLIPHSVISYRTNYILICFTLRQKILLNNSAKPAKILHGACFVFDLHFYSDRAKMRGVERERVIIHFSAASERSILHSLILLECKANKV